MTTVDSAKRRGRVSPVHTHYQPRVTCIVVLSDIPAAASAIARRIRANARDRQCGSFLFVDDSGRAYVVSEESTAAPVWCREKCAWLVGLYTIGPRAHSMDPTISGLVEDLADHLAVAAP